MTIKYVQVGKLKPSLFHLKCLGLKSLNNGLAKIKQLT